MKTPALHFRIDGQVQGVGFRYSMCKEARRLRLAGWVRNRADGSVEAVAAGDEESLHRLVQWAQHGPAGARVRGVRTRTATDNEAADLDDPFAQRASA